ncbi:MAG: hypothetical protein HYT85_02665 [candidate division NC10 bacterium]|nr:hypothetical protein [candidate division NC10 bacterium]MBI2113978.1 hypothetical protein [candidate division NC10 bacterium]
MDYVKAINDALDGFVKILWPLATALAGVGLATMAVLQVIKDLTPARRWFQQLLFEQWVRRRAEETGQNPEDALTDLVGLATAGDARSLYDLPIEQLAGQVNAATQVVLDYPSQHEALLRILAYGASEEDLRSLLAPPPRRRTEEMSEAERQVLTTFVDARNRVTHQIQRSLDALQIAIGSRWKWLMQLCSVIFSGVFIFVALALFAPGSVASPRRVIFGLVVAILGGFLAPVARDLVAALQGLRTRAR